MTIHRPVVKRIQRNVYTVECPCGFGKLCQTSHNVRDYARRVARDHKLEAK